LFDSGFFAGVDLLLSDFGHSILGQLDFFFVLSASHWLSVLLSALAGICTSCWTGPALATGAVAAGALVVGYGVVDGAMVADGEA
jgi:hypothetical protein